MPPVYLLTLGKTYYDKGFFNLGVEVDRYVRRDSGPITLALGHKSHIIEGHVNREANPNGTPRIFGRNALRDWFHKNFREMETVEVHIISANELLLSKDSRVPKSVGKQESPKTVRSKPALSQTLSTKPSTDQKPDVQIVKISNYQRVTLGFDILIGVLAPYLGRELKAKYGADWWNKAVLRGLDTEWQRRDLPSGGDDQKLIQSLDVKLCLHVIDAHWPALFQKKMKREARNWVRDLISARNQWAHKGHADLPDDDAWRAIDSMERLSEEIEPKAAKRLQTLKKAMR